MKAVTLFNLIQSLKNAISVDGRQPLKAELKKSKAGEEYYFVSFPFQFEWDKKAASTSEWVIVDQHLTIFRTPAEMAGEFSDYHCTFNLVDPKKQSITVHVYFNENDALCKNYYRVTESGVKKAKETAGSTPVPFSVMASRSIFTNKAKTLIFPVIRKLREQQSALVTKYENKYDALTQEMETLSRGQGDAWEPVIRDQFIKKTLQCIDILKQWQLYLPNPQKHEGLIQFFERYQSIKVILPSDSDAGKVEAKVESVALLSIEPEVSNEIITRASVVKAQRQDSFALFDEKFQPIRKVFLESVKGKSLSAEQAAKIHQIYKELDGLLTSPNAYSDEQAYGVLVLLLLARNKLRKYAIKNIVSKAVDIGSIEPYYSYLGELNQRELNDILEKDDLKTWQSLFVKGVISTHTKLADNSLLYEMAFESERRECIAFFLTQGIPLIAMSYRTLGAIFTSSNDNSISIDKLQRYYAAMNRMNIIATQVIQTPEQWIFCIDESIRFLQEQQYRVNEKTGVQVKPAIVIQRLLAEKARVRRGDFSVAKKAEKPITTEDNALLNVAQFLDFLIQFTRLLKFVFSAITEDSRLFKDFFALSAMQTTREDSLDESMRAAILLYEKISPVLPNVLQLFQYINTRIDQIPPVQKSELIQNIKVLFRSVIPERGDQNTLYMNVGRAFFDYMTEGETYRLITDIIRGLGITMDDIQPMLACILPHLELMPSGNSAAALSAGGTTPRVRNSIGSVSMFRPAPVSRPDDMSAPASEQREGGECSLM